MSRIALEVNATLTRPGLQAVFSLAGPGVTGIMGPSGCGKSTLLHAIAGVTTETLQADSQILFNQQPWFPARPQVPTHTRPLALQFQDLRLLPRASTGKQLALAQRFSFHPQPHIWARQLIKELALDTLLEQIPARLSGGEQQRVALARCLIRHAPLTLLDEPLSALDAALRARVLSLIRALAEHQHLIIVSHRHSELGALGATLLRVQGEAPMRQLRPCPGNLAGADTDNLFHGQVHRHHRAEAVTEVSTPGGRLWIAGLHGEAGMALSLTVAARAISISHHRPAPSSMLNVLEGIVTDVHVLAGEGALVTVNWHGIPVHVWITLRSLQQLCFSQGDRVWLQCKATVTTEL